MKYHLTFLAYLIIFFPLHSQSWNQYQKLVASDRQEGLKFGSEIVCDGNQLFVSSQLNRYYDNYGAVSGLYLYKKSNNNLWEEKQVILPSDEEYAGKGFGSSFDINGDDLIVGSSFDDYELYGAAYIFLKNNDGFYEEIQKIYPEYLRPLIGFGLSVAINDKFAFIAQSEYYDFSENGDLLNALGKVYVYKKSLNGSWKLSQELQPSNLLPYSYFGYSLDIDNSYAIIGAYNANKVDDDYSTGTGAAYIFKLNENDVWEEVQKIVPQDAELFDFFGESVVIEYPYIVIGAFNETHFPDNDPHGYGEGAVYVFKEDENSDWIQVQKLKAKQPCIQQHFGSSISLNEDMLIVGAWLDNNILDDGSGSDSTRTGSVHIYKRNEDSLFQLLQKIIGKDSENGDGFGVSTCIEEGTIYIGSIGNDYDESNANYMNNSGALYIFTYDENSSNYDFNPKRCFVVYPNPTSDHLHIEYNQQQYPDLTLKIYDSFGRFKGIYRDMESVDVNGFEEGLHFIEFWSGEHRLKVRKFVKL